ncbi:proliferating cell nuclear antigen [Pelomyxa schiedti]|nr:proliferating cell nuclear antigen [Pelomyxa schiedti]
MLEARLMQAGVLKRILDALKDLVNEVNFDCSAAGISLQAMDTSHVSLVSLMLRPDGFLYYRCDRNIRMGINLTHLAKVLKCANNEDQLTIKAEDPNPTDTVTFLFESKDGDRVSDFDIKLMEFETDRLGIPDMEYLATVTMSSVEFQRICRDIAVIGDTVTISVKKDEVRFSVSGDLGTGNISCKHSTSTAVDKADSSAPPSITTISLREPVTLSFALRYLNFFTRATSLSQDVSLQLSPEAPLAVAYNIVDLGSIKYYLAPKVDEPGSSSS